MLRTFLTRLPTFVDLVVFDSPSGTQPLATLARNWSQALVVFCRPSRQFLQGTRYFLQRLIQDLSADQSLDVLLVLSAVPSSSSFQANRNEAFSAAKSMVVELQDEAKRRKSNVRIRIPWSSDAGQRAPLVIPEVDRLKWNDEVLAEGADPEVQAGFVGYQRLAEVIDQLRVGSVS
jgi:hypothetical protein